LTASILKKQEVILLTRTREVLEEILKTLELQNEHKSVKAYREALRDLKEGKTRSYKDFTNPAPAPLSQHL